MFYRAIILAIILFSQTSLALEIEDHFTNQEQEQQATDIFKQIRCMVCTGESINDSKADLAKDMRILIRNEIKSGKTPEEIITYLHERYGDAVLMKPPFQPNTYILWLMPIILLFVGVVIVIKSTRKNNSEK